MRVLIVEDEKLAAERLQTLLLACNPDAEVVACLESIEETVQYLKTHAHPDLMLLDIHLSDGHSFDIFKEVNYQRPVIFTTAYDQYALDAFRLFSIDYILKPVTQESLAAALNKLQSLPVSFSANGLNQLPVKTAHQYKKRFLGKVGQRLFFVQVTDIAFFQADNKIVHMVDKDGNRYLVEHTLERLEEMLDPQLFFRLNRRFIVQIDAIQQVKPYFNSRLKLAVQGASPTEDMVISRERVADFKAWAEA